jgi:hypothetical protein
MKIFLIFQKEDENYDSLKTEGEIVPIFKYIKRNPNIKHIKDTCEKILDTADVANDFIVFNGPSYLCAIAGYIWMTQEKRTHMNFYTFNKRTGLYCKHTDPLVEEDKDMTHG